MDENELLTVVRTGHRTANEIATETDNSPTYISRELKPAFDNGVLDREPTGPNGAYVYYLPAEAPSTETDGKMFGSDGYHAASHTDTHPYLPSSDESHP